MFKSDPVARRREWNRQRQKARRLRGMNIDPNVVRRVATRCPGCGLKIVMPCPYCAGMALKANEKLTRRETAAAAAELKQQLTR